MRNMRAININAINFISGICINKSNFGLRLVRINYFTITKTFRFQDLQKKIYRDNYINKIIAIIHMRPVVKYQRQ